jgi:parvulin-like peptidyl-prolyl isomerase
MTENRELDFSLPPPSRGRQPRRNRVLLLLLSLILLAVAADIALELRPPATAPDRGSAQLAPEARKQLALRLEQQGLHQAAASAWQDYMDGALLRPEQAASVAYRIGTLQQQARDYEAALSAYYRSEALAPLAELSPEIGRRVQECLERLGKFAALRHELADRVDLGTDAAAASSETVAEIGVTKISRAGLDRMIAEMLEQQLRPLRSLVPESELLKQKQALLQKFSTDRERLRLLNQFVMEEILYRKARAAGIAEEGDTRAMIADATRKICAQQLLNRELERNIKLSNADLRTYYEAHRQDYITPRRYQLSHIQVDTEKQAQELLPRLQADTQTFAELAREFSQDSETAAQGGRIPGWIEADAERIAGIGRAAPVLAAAAALAEPRVLSEPVDGDSGYHLVWVRALEPERLRPFAEVEAEVYRELRSTKDREVQARLLESLKQEYDVVIHSARFAGAAESSSVVGTATDSAPAGN